MTRSLGLALLLLTLCAAGASAGTKVGFYGCRGFVAKHPTAVVEPRSIMVACGDGNFYVTGIRWTAWTGTSAKGTGKVHANDCKPYCAAGHFHTKTGSVALSKVISCKGARVFTYIRVTSPIDNYAGSFDCR